MNGVAATPQGQGVKPKLPVFQIGEWTDSLSVFLVVFWSLTGFNRRECAIRRTGQWTYEADQFRHILLDLAFGLIVGLAIDCLFTDFLHILAAPVWPIHKISGRMFPILPEASALPLSDLNKIDPIKPTAYSCQLPRSQRRGCSCSRQPYQAEERLPLILIRCE